MAIVIICPSSSATLRPHCPPGELISCLHVPTDESRAYINFLQSTISNGDAKGNIRNGNFPSTTTSPTTVAKICIGNPFSSREPCLWLFELLQHERKMVKAVVFVRTPSTPSLQQMMRRTLKKMMMMMVIVAILHLHAYTASDWERDAGCDAIGWNRLPIHNIPVLVKCRSMQWAAIKLNYAGELSYSFCNNVQFKRTIETSHFLLLGFMWRRKFKITR